MRAMPCAAVEAATRLALWAYVSKPLMRAMPRAAGRCTSLRADGPGFKALDVGDAAAAGDRGLRDEKSTTVSKPLMRAMPRGRVNAPHRATHAPFQSP